MFSPSDFNEDVSVFKDSQGTPFGNYCSAPVEPQYIAEPDHTTYIEGRAPLNTLPAQWWNWLLNQITKKLNGVNKYVGNLFSELSNLLGLMGITPTEPSTPTGNQLSTGFLNNYPNVISKFMHTIASVWTKQNPSTVGTVTTTQINKLAVFEDINESDSSTTPATVTDTYNTKYVDKLPVELGGTGGNTPESAMVNLASPLTKIASQAGQLSDMIIFDRENSNSSHTIAKMDLIELGRLISSSNVNVPVITTNSTVLTGTALSTSESFGVFFTDNINGANTSTPLQLTYNGTLIPVKVCKNGVLVDVYAHQLDDSGTIVYRYLQAYTTLNLIYDSANFIIIGNPVVLSSSDYVIYANGKIGDEPIATLKEFYLSSAPYGYLVCDGRDTSGTSEELSIHYPILYAKLGNTNVLPDFRECAIVGIGQNSTNTMGAHDVFTLGEFKDDQMQAHTHGYTYGRQQGTNLGFDDGGTQMSREHQWGTTGVNSGRSSSATVTRGKRKGALICIKAL